ncbi:YwqI/YxiC family protein [Bacillus safensis]|uniref:YwqI/YxiC family protein n=1 Tax=Bacillus safensis TaxID=561879 RepID=UPI002280192C|nr:YwqI/YxiC family protein [Bacillus safensis]MCY7673913.1 YwqI/YxiC family protein [Bacillus safensis]MCY7696912.1 YwqI/YxiC family protein [Bacillus safensis]MEC3626468.1 YwqI/YxiC family protein [Bacillus safensis]
MGQIKLNYQTVIDKLDEVSQAVESLAMKKAADKAGENSLEFVTKWTAREAEVSEMVSSFKEALIKNVQDTRSNVKTLKEQDEAIAAK